MSASQGMGFHMKYIPAIITCLNCNQESKSLLEIPPGGKRHVGVRLYVKVCPWVSHRAVLNLKLNLFYSFREYIKKIFSNYKISRTFLHKHHSLLSQISVHTLFSQSAALWMSSALSCHQAFAHIFSFLPSLLRCFKYLLGNAMPYLGSRVWTETHAFF